MARLLTRSGLHAVRHELADEQLTAMSCGLSAEEVDELVRDSLYHAREDFEARNLADVRVEAGRVILAVGLLDEGEREGSGGPAVTFHARPRGRGRQLRA